MVKELAKLIIIVNLLFPYDGSQLYATLCNFMRFLLFA